MDKINILSPELGDQVTPKYNSNKPHINYELKSNQAKRVHQTMIESFVYLVKNIVLAKDNNPIKILEVGCGRGEILQSLSQISYVEVQGVDIDPVCVDLSSRFAPCQIGSVENLEEYYPTDSFDLVIASHLLEHVYNPTLALEQISRISKKFVLIAVPNPVRPSRILKYLRGNLHAEHSTHVQVWDPGHFDNFIRNHTCLNIHTWQPNIVTIFPQKMFSFPVINPLLTMLETKLMTKWFPFFSSSLIVLAEKSNES